MTQDEYFTEETYDGETYVRVREEALFYTADYYIDVAIKSKAGRWRAIWTSPVYSVRPNRTAVIEWLHGIITGNPMMFHNRNIDYEELYKAVGGDVADLYG